MSPEKRLYLSLAVLVAVFVVGTVGYRLIDSPAEPSWLDAAYMTAITLSTVGFGEIWPLGPAGRLWTIGIIVFGIGAVSVAVSAMLTLFVSGELAQQRTRKRMDDAIEHLEGHVVLCGYGRMGGAIAEELVERGLKVVVLELQRDLALELREAGLPHIIGDATDENLLLRAGLMRAKALVAGLPSDADNVYITLTAHALRPELCIVARAEQDTTEAKLRRAGARRVICPTVVGAKTVASVLTRPNVVDFVEIARRGVELELDEYTVAAGSWLAEKALRETSLRERAGVTVVAIKHLDGKTLYSPGPDARLTPGDTIIMVGPAGASKTLDRLVAGAAHSPGS